MNIGDLRHRVTIQHKVSGKDEDGLPVEEWRPLAEIWAAVEPLQGREFWQAKAVQSEATVRVRIWYRPDITTAMRVQYGNRILDIETMIDPEERHVELHLLCKEVVPGG